LARALSSELYDDERALLKIDMSEFMEKHAVAKLIGAPPGYDGFDVGGLLTNEIRKNPRRVILLDEIEKAHKDVFNILLQILDDGRLTDGAGRTVSFSDSIIILTSNIGKDDYVSEDDFDVAQQKAIEKLNNAFPPELLNRFNGRQNIVGFKALELPNIEKIARRDLMKLSSWADSGKPGLHVAMADDDIRKMCLNHYNKTEGARGIAGYIDSTIKPAVSKTVLFEDGAEGTMQVDYDEDHKTVFVHPPKADAKADISSAAQEFNKLKV